MNHCICNNRLKLDSCKILRYRCSYPRVQRPTHSFQSNRLTLRVRFRGSIYTVAEIVKITPDDISRWTSNKMPRTRKRSRRIGYGPDYIEGHHCAGVTGPAGNGRRSFVLLLSPWRKDIRMTCTSHGDNAGKMTMNRAGTTKRKQEIQEG